MTYESSLDKSKLAELAGSITSMHMEALAELGPHGLSWTDLVFATIVSLKAIAQMHEDEDDKELRRVVTAGLEQDVVGKRFKSKEEAEDWAQTEGLMAPEGTKH